MGRVVVPHRLDIDRDDLSLAEKIAHRGEERGAPAAVRPGLDHEVGLRLEHDLLVHPEIERVLERLSAEPGRLGPRVGQVEHVVGARDRGPVEPLVDTEARARHAPSQVVLHRRGSLGGHAQAEHLEVTIRDRRERRGPDRCATLVELGDEAIEHVTELLVRREREPALADELGMPAAVPEGRRQAARERLEQGIRAGVVAARRDVDVLRPEKVARARSNRAGRRRGSARSAPAGGRRR